MPTSPSDGNTLKSHKRSCTTDDAVDVDSAAKLLGVSPRSIRNYVEKGVLRRLGEGNKILVSLQDIYSTASTLARCLDFAGTARTALKALVTAVRAERRLERLEALLGVDVVCLSLEEEDVVALHNQCKEMVIEYTEDMRAPVVLDWAYKFAAVSEEYLELVELHTGDSEPWVPMMEAAQKLNDAAPRESFRHRKDLEVAYAYLASARAHLHQVAYFYIRHRHGARVANTACPDVTTSDRDNQIINLIFANAQKFH